MGLRIDVPGLERVVPEVPDGAFVLLEGGPEPAKTILLDDLAARSLSDGRKPQMFLGKPRSLGGRSSHGETAPAWNVLSVGDLEGLVAPADDQEPHHITDAPSSGSALDGDLLIDSLGMLWPDRPAALVLMLEQLRRHVRSQGRALVATLDVGTLEPQAASAVRYLADGIVSFLERDDDDGVARYLRVPKWPDGTTHARNIYYEVKEARLLVDTRHRVL